MKIICSICGGTFDCDNERYAQAFGQRCIRERWTERLCFCKECYSKKMGKSKGIIEMFKCMPSAETNKLDKVC